MLENFLQILALTLTASFLLSLPARRHWVFDLFCNFLIQYTVGGIILALLLTFFHDWFLVKSCLAVSALSAFRIWRAFPMASTAPEGNRITIAHYNRLYTNPQYDAMIAWLRTNADIFDIVSLHEVTPEGFEKLQSINDLYPYRFPKTKRHDTDVVLLSRHPITESTMVETKADIPTNPGLRIKTQTPVGEIVVYGIHAENPLDFQLQWQRNAELTEMAKVIVNDTSPNIIFLGDWNITPFSPHFKNVLKISGLKNEYSNRWPLVTWPVWLKLPFLQIPIDHILASKNLKLIEKKTGPAMGSDHHALVASFIVS